jgi:hypothetical protein
MYLCMYVCFIKKKQFWGTRLDNVVMLILAPVVSDFINTSGRVVFERNLKI